MNPLKTLQNYGQSVWLDFIRRNLIKSGELGRMIDEDGLRESPPIPRYLKKQSPAAPTTSRRWRRQGCARDSDPMALYEAIAIKDIQDAADVLRPVYDATKTRDGYVSLEVSPYLANETKETIEEARRLWKAVARPNVLIKVPATQAGVPAIQKLISEGINVNVTLLFAQSAYEAVANAYIAGLAEHEKGGGDVSHIASVASFFVSRIDSLVDSMIDKKLAANPAAQERMLLESLKGKVAIALREAGLSDLPEVLSKRAVAGAHQRTHRHRGCCGQAPQPRIKYRDVMYVEELLAQRQLTPSAATMDSFRDHGLPRESLTTDLEEAHDTMESLQRVGISMKKVTDQLVEEGVKLFADAFDKLLAAVDKGRKAELKSMIDRQSYKLPDDLDAAVKATLEDWRVNGKIRRLWALDASLWTGTDEANWLGWLGIVTDQLEHIDHLKAIAKDAKSFKHVVLLGMGGSSLCPEVMKLTFGKTKGYPELHVLDSTDPQQIKALESDLDLKKSLFIVSSKSGSTLEPNIFKQYFYERTRKAVGAKEVSKHFIAITDPGSKMEQIAKSESFRSVFYGVSSIGGRYSALSDFGMVPAAAMGVDVQKFLENTDLMVHSCGPSVPPEENPGVVLGAIMGTLAKHGRDKVTVIASPAIFDLGAWLEQLLAESTGKIGKGLIPVDREHLGASEVYGNDRLFAYVRLDDGADPDQDAAVNALEQAGQPVVRIAINNIYDLGQEFFRWEIATAVAGSIIGINAFNQPDVEAAKIEARNLTSEYEKNGSLPLEKPILEADGISSTPMRATPLNWSKSRAVTNPRRACSAHI